LMAGTLRVQSGRGTEERMNRLIREAAPVVLFVALVIAVTGVWVCLWLPPW
jgi:hypothetical protein